MQKDQSCLYQSALLRMDRTAYPHSRILTPYTIPFRSAPPPYRPPSIQTHKFLTADLC